MAENRRDDKAPASPADVSVPGMLGDGTEEQNLDQPGNPDARITEKDVQDAFGKKSGDATGSKP